MTVFTNPEVTLIHEILGLFEITTFDWYSYKTWPGGVVTSVPFTSQIDFSIATDRLAAIITDIESKDDGGGDDDGRRARISTVLSEYSDVSLDTARVKTGGASGGPGIRYDPEEQRDHLKHLIETLLGFALDRGPLPLIGLPGGGSGRGTSIPR